MWGEAGHINIYNIASYNKYIYAMPLGWAGLGWAAYPYLCVCVFVCVAAVVFSPAAHTHIRTHTHIHTEPQTQVFRTVFCIYI